MMPPVFINGNIQFHLGANGNAPSQNEQLAMWLEIQDVMEKYKIINMQACWNPFAMREAQKAIHKNPIQPNQN